MTMCGRLTLIQVELYRVKAGLSQFHDFFLPYIVLFIANSLPFEMKMAWLTQ